MRENLGVRKEEYVVGFKFRDKRFILFNKNKKIGWADVDTVYKNPEYRPKIYSKKAAKEIVKSKLMELTYCTFDVEAEVYPFHYFKQQGYYSSS